jgi:hypothetical protein
MAMDFYNLIFKNLVNLPLVCFLMGIGLAMFKPLMQLPSVIKKTLTPLILFSIGLKGGGPLVEHALTQSSIFFVIIGFLMLWALIQPVISFFILKAFTKIDQVTAAAIAACFGSISVITFVTAISFLDQLQINYQSFIIVAIAVMDVPAIVSGLFLAKDKQALKSDTAPSFLALLKQSLMNKAIVAILLGLAVGGVLLSLGHHKASYHLLSGFKPLLALFLFDMGLSIGSKRKELRSFSWSLSLFGLYMPLIGGFFGLLMSYLLNLDPGTGTLMAVLCASASYIAVPAAMKIALPLAKEALYLPLSLAMAFPFNIVIGIPLYYYIATLILKN